MKKAIANLSGASFNSGEIWRNIYWHQADLDALQVVLGMFTGRIYDNKDNLIYLLSKQDYYL
jgi:hypothetical protein